MERVITTKGKGWRVGASSDGTITVMLDNGRQLAFPADQVAPLDIETERQEIPVTDESVMDESDNAEAAAQAACEGFSSVEAWVTDTQAALAEGPVADKAPGTDVAWVEGFLAWADDNAHRVDRMVVTGEVVRTEDLPGEIIPVTITLVTVDKHRRPLIAESVEHFKVNAAPGGRRVHNREFNHQVKAFRDLTNCCEQGPKVGPHLHMSAQPTVIQSARYGDMGKAHVVHTVTVGDIITINGRPFILTNDRWAADPILLPAS